MATCEPMALYEAVISHELKNNVFSNREEICEVVKSLISKKILSEKDGLLNDREMEFLLKFGDIQTGDTKVLTFTDESFAEKMEIVRENIYREKLSPGANK